MPSEYKPPKCKPPKNVLRNLYKLRAYIQNFTVYYLHFFKQEIKKCSLRSIKKLVNGGVQVSVHYSKPPKSKALNLAMS